MAYEIPLTKDFKPQIFYDISDVINEKVELLNLFKSQMDKLYLKANAIKGLAEYRALQSRLNIASEACINNCKVVYVRDGAKKVVDCVNDHNTVYKALIDADPPSQTVEIYARDIYGDSTHLKN
jgi:hypothetical protein